MAFFSSNKLRSLLLLFLVLTAMALAGFVYFNFERLPSSISVKITDKGLDVGIKNFHLVEEKDGKMKWVVDADKAEILKSQDITKLEKVRLVYYRPQEKDVHLTADRGLINNKTKDMEAFGDVVVFDGAYKLNSEKLYFKSAPKLITTDEFVRIDGERFHVTGDGMVSDLNKESIEILKNVEMTIHREEKN